MKLHFSSEFIIEFGFGVLYVKLGRFEMALSRKDGLILG